MGSPNCSGCRGRDGQIPIRIYFYCCLQIRHLLFGTSVGLFWLFCIFFSAFQSTSSPSSSPSLVTAFSFDYSHYHHLRRHHHQSSNNLPWVSLKFRSPTPRILSGSSIRFC